MDKFLKKRNILIQEKQLITSLLEQMFGYYALQLGLIGEADFLAASRASNKIYLSERFSDITENACIVGDYSQLPFIPDSIDTIVAAHILERVQNPLKVLREIYTALIPEGYLILTGINPFSFLGLQKKTDHSKDNLIRLGKVKSWLDEVGFEELQHLWLKHFWIGDVYIIVAQKRVRGLRPVLEEKIYRKRATQPQPIIKPTSRV